MSSVHQNINASSLDAMSKREVIDLCLAIIADFTAVHARITGIAAKLDLDAGVTDTNYGSLWPAPAVASRNLTV
jgi:hypothetical protein